VGGRRPRGGGGGGGRRAWGGDARPQPKKGHADVYTAYRSAKADGRRRVRLTCDQRQPARGQAECGRVHPLGPPPCPPSPAAREPRQGQKGGPRGPTSGTHVGPRCRRQTAHVARRSGRLGRYTRSGGCRALGARPRATHPCARSPPPGWTDPPPERRLIRPTGGGNKNKETTRRAPLSKPLMMEGAP